MQSQQMTFKDRISDPANRLTAHLCTIPSATVTQAMAAAGSDAVIIDLEHGAIDYATAHAMIAATAGTACAPLVRVTENDVAQVTRPKAIHSTASDKKQYSGSSTALRNT